MEYRLTDRFENFLRKPLYRDLLNWACIEKQAGLPSGRIASVVDNRESFTEEENLKLYRFFSEMARDCLNMPYFTG